MYGLNQVKGELIYQDFDYTPLLLGEIITRCNICRNLKYPFKILKDSVWFHHGWYPRMVGPFCDPWFQRLMVAAKAVNPLVPKSAIWHNVIT